MSEIVETPVAHVDATEAETKAEELNVEKDHAISLPEGDDKPENLSEKPGQDEHTSPDDVKDSCSEQPGQVKDEGVADQEVTTHHEADKIQTDASTVQSGDEVKSGESQIKAADSSKIPQESAVDSASQKPESTDFSAPDELKSVDAFGKCSSCPPEAHCTKNCPPAKTEQDEPAKTEQDEPAKTEQDEPAKTEQDEPAKTEQDEPAKTEQDKPAKTEQDEPAQQEDLKQNVTSGILDGESLAAPAI